MPLIASDGLEYKDLAARLKGEPEENTRNGNILHYRKTWGGEVAGAYAEGFNSVCPKGDPGPSQAFKQAHDAGIKAAYATDKFGRPSGPVYGYGKIQFSTPGASDFGVVSSIPR